MFKSHYLAKGLVISSLRYFSFGIARPVLLSIAHIAVVLIFIIFGFPKVMGFGNAVRYMASLSAPVPMLVVIIAIVMEVPTAILVVLSFFAHPLATLFIFYALGTAVIDHRYWDMISDAVEPNMINPWKNVGIAGTFLLLVITGSGAISLDRRQEKYRMRHKRPIRPAAPTPVVGLIGRNKRRIRHRTPSATKPKLLRRPVHPTFYKLQQRNPQRHLWNC